MDYLQICYSYYCSRSPDERQLLRSRLCVEWRWAVRAWNRETTMTASRGPFAAKDCRDDRIDAMYCRERLRLDYLTRRSRAETLRQGWPLDETTNHGHLRFSMDFSRWIVGLVRVNVAELNVEWLG